MNETRKKEHKEHYGVVAPLVTPVNEKGELDEAALRRLVDFQVEGGVQGLFVLSMTGEGPSVPREWRQRVVQVALDQARKRVPVYAAIADPSLNEAAALGRDFLRMGARAVAAPLPNYYRLLPGEQFEYFAELARRLKGPLVLYDIPSLSHMALERSVIEHLRAFSNVVGIKDSSGDRAQMSDLLETYRGDPNFCVLVGAPQLAASALLAGADGIVLAPANLNPGLCCRLYTAAATGDTRLAGELQRELDELTASFLPDGNFGRGIARMKRLMSQKGLCGPGVFPPLQPAE